MMELDFNNKGKSRCLLTQIKSNLERERRDFRKKSNFVVFWFVYFPLDAVYKVKAVCV